MRSVAVMISGPMPSPYATVTGTFFAVAMVVVNSFSSVMGPRRGRFSYGA